MSDRLNINQWAEEDKPREKLERLGAGALTDAELLAIIVGSGSDEEDAVSLMKRVMGDCQQSLNALGKLSMAQLCAYRGIGKAKAVMIMAACELGRRRLLSAPPQRPQIKAAADIYRLMRGRMQDLDVEELWALLMNQNGKLIKEVMIGRGGLTEVSADIRIILREALLANATIVAVCHNHPSGSLRPSRADEELTKAVRRACDVMRLHFMDHVIITDGAFFSFYEEGRL